MKNILLGAASAVAMLAAGNAFAAGNASTIDQIGYAENASVDQTGSPSDAVAVINQGLTATQATDGYNLANVTQGGGAGNQAYVTQSQGAYGASSNPSNVSNSNQQGSQGLVQVFQVGNDSSSISQLAGSSNEYALVGQSNNGNSSSISQAGQSEFALANQEQGTGNSASIVQSGIGYGNTGYGVGNYAPTTPSPRYHGPDNLYWSENLPSEPTSVLPGAAAGNTRYGQTGAVVDQLGSNNNGNINQAGYQNFADVSQENDSNPGGNYGAISQGNSLYHSDAVMYQLGQYNTAIINQSGSGSTYSTVWQDGNFNQAYSTQVGSEYSVIGQGVTGDGPRTPGVFGPAVNSDFASVDQTSGGDNSLVTQLGNNDSAWVAQTSTANATSTILQSGNYDVASVHQ